jgi:hypothetical protein
MNIENAFPGKYLKAADLQGRRATVTIKDVGMEDIGDDGMKPVVTFVGKEKGLVLNRTNANMIIEIVKSEETDNWKGRQVALYPTKVDFQGKRVDAIRVDHPSTGGAALPPPPPPPVNLADDEIPF